VVLAAGLLTGKRIQSVCRRETIRIASQWDQLTTTMTESDAAAKPCNIRFQSIRSVQGGGSRRGTFQNDYRAKSFRSSTKGKPGWPWQNSEQTPEELHISIFDPEGAFSLHRSTVAMGRERQHVSEVLARKETR